MASRILFLFSDTGGGHRASAQAVARALDIQFPGMYEVELLDPFVDGSSNFLRWLVYRYAPLIRYMAPLWGVIFHLTDHRPPFKAAIKLVGNQFRPGLRRRLGEQPVRAIVSFHPLTNHVVAETLKEMALAIPLITVITDLSDFHRGWMAKGADLVITPSPESRRYCIKMGLDPRRVFSAGLPVDPNFTGPLDPGEKRALRERLGFSDMNTLLLVGGGEGSGGLDKYVSAIDDANMGLQMVVVCGRNERLATKLRAATWRGPVHVMG
ncbi:MAG: MGDG synthase family glycosyltransferase, partial [Candidatus Dormibacteria bacterium]